MSELGALCVPLSGLGVRIDLNAEIAEFFAENAENVFYAVVKVA